MNTRPPTIVGCDGAIVTEARLNAHFSLSRATLLGERPALRASWNRELVTLVLQPFQRGAFIAVFKAADPKGAEVLQVRVNTGGSPAIPVGAMKPSSVKICAVDMP